jgi:hypothetical protein
MSRRTAKVMVNHIEKLNHDYDLVVKKNSIKLYRSKNTLWSEPGELSAKLVDIGDSVTVRLNQRLITLDYAELHEMHILIEAFQLKSFKFDV